MAPAAIAAPAIVMTRERLLAGPLRCLINDIVYSLSIRVGLSVQAFGPK
jgi:hypothetical protein